MNVCVLWLMAVGLFQVPFKGNFLLFFSASVLFVFCTTGIGLLISLLVQTQMAALIITMVVAMIPTILFSGLLVPVASLTRGARSRRISSRHVLHRHRAREFSGKVSVRRCCGSTCWRWRCLPPGWEASRISSLPSDRRHEGRSMTAGRRQPPGHNGSRALTWKELLQLSRDVPLLLFVVYSFLSPCW